MTKPKKLGYQGQKLPPHIREGIKQMIESGFTKAATARAFNVALTTVYSVLKTEDPEIVREKRQEAMARIASKMTDKVEDIMENLEDPDATYMQNATVAGILTDKVEKLDKRLSDQTKEDRIEAGDLTAAPDNVDTLVGILRVELRELGKHIPGLYVDNNTDLAEAAAKIEESMIVEAEVETLDDLDPNGKA